MICWCVKQELFEENRYLYFWRNYKEWAQEMHECIHIYVYTFIQVFIIKVDQTWYYWSHPAVFEPNLLPSSWVLVSVLASVASVRVTCPQPIPQGVCRPWGRSQETCEEKQLRVYKWAPYNPLLPLNERRWTSDMQDLNGQAPKQWPYEGRSL